jgi:hypothetical protein
MYRRPQRAGIFIGMTSIAPERSSNRREILFCSQRLGPGQTEPSPSARSKTMTDELLAAMHEVLAKYHRSLAKKATLDIVQQYHADLAQRFADEAAQIPRRTVILERLHERELETRQTMADE